ncbi:YjjG family noncanonical pyrimidine nucleotidase [Gangjinia marincola]|uniref:YjjG family noncanonical pyrimidine nucleotidase n=1 Tax=Gangjinia marincola TaxID=578463 RepID=A0ABN1MK95_9FLAO
MKNKEIQHIFFDLDHTLWDFEKNSALAYEDIFELHGLSINLEKFIAVYSPINFEYWRLYRNDKISKGELRFGRLDKAFRTYGQEVSATMIDRLAKDYITYLPKNNYLFRGCIEVLEYLNDRYSLHIITNGFEEVQHKKLKKSNIDHYFKTVTTSEDAGKKKPHPLIFEKAMQKANASPQYSLMVGDSYEADICGGRDFGLDTVYFNPKGEVTDSRSISRLEELKNIL